jgi:predicted dehydrogenase
MCLTAADADLLLATSAEMDRTITVHQSRRWDGDFLALRRAVETDLLGEVFNMETFVGGFDHPCRWWHSDEALSGGAVYDWGSHHIDWILALYGSAPDLVQATSHKRVWRDVSNSDQIDVHMRWSDGREERFIQTDVAAIRKPKLYVQGTKGTAVAEYRPIVDDQLIAGRGHVADAWHHAEAAVDIRVGRYEQVFAASEAAGGASIDPDVVRWWEVLGTLKWGIMCILQANAHLAGFSRSHELAAIGRRVCENEHDLFLALEGRW